MAIIFADREAYLRFSRKDLGDAAEAIIGYFRLDTNRITMYDLTGVASSPVGRGRRASSAEIARILAQPDAARNIATIVHEATHQIAFNCFPHIGAFLDNGFTEEEMKMVEWGQAAKDMVGRVPESIEVVRPLRNGVIAEYEITENLLRFSIQKVCGSMLVFRPRILITIPCGITSVERRAVHEVGLGTNSRDVMLMEQRLMQ